MQSKDQLLQHELHKVFHKFTFPTRVGSHIELRTALRVRQVVEEAATAYASRQPVSTARTILNDEIDRYYKGLPTDCDHLAFGSAPKFESFEHTKPYGDAHDWFVAHKNWPDHTPIPDMILTSLSVQEAESFGGLLSATDMIQLYKLHGHPEGTYKSIIPYELTQQVVKGLIREQDKIEAQEQSQESKHLKTPYEVPALEGRDNTPGPHHMDSVVLEPPNVDPPAGINTITGHIRQKLLQCASAALQLWTCTGTNDESVDIPVLQPGQNTTTLTVKLNVPAEATEEEKLALEYFNNKVHNQVRIGCYFIQRDGNGVQRCYNIPDRFIFGPGPVADAPAPPGWQLSETPVHVTSDTEVANSEEMLGASPITLPGTPPRCSSTQNVVRNQEETGTTAVPAVVPPPLWTEEEKAVGPIGTTPHRPKLPPSPKMPPPAYNPVRHAGSSSSSTTERPVQKAPPKYKMPPTDMTPPPKRRMLHKQSPPAINLPPIEEETGIAQEFLLASGNTSPVASDGDTRSTIVSGASDVASVGASTVEQVTDSGHLVVRASSLQEIAVSTRGVALGGTKNVTQMLYNMSEAEKTVALMTSQREIERTEDNIHELHTKLLRISESAWQPIDVQLNEGIKRLLEITLSAKMVFNPALQQQRENTLQAMRGKRQQLALALIALTADTKELNTLHHPSFDAVICLNQESPRYEQWCKALQTHFRKWRAKTDDGTLSVSEIQEKQREYEIINNELHDQAEGQLIDGMTGKPLSPIPYNGTSQDHLRILMLAKTDAAAARKLAVSTAWDSSQSSHTGNELTLHIIPMGQVSLAVNLVPFNITVDAGTTRVRDVIVKLATDPNLKELQIREAYTLLHRTWLKGVGKMMM